MREASARAHPYKRLAWVCDPQKGIVCVCHGNTRPPSRSWWLVDECSGTARELPFEEAAKIIDLSHPWR